MTKEIEREYTFLLNELPSGLEDFPSVIIEDNYIPVGEEHPVLRIRRKGERYEITKKYPMDVGEDGEGGDASRQVEHTIPLSKVEYEGLNGYDGKRFVKRRFYYESGGVKSDIDVYLGALKGLATADFEFENDAEMTAFVKPDFTGEDVSHELMLAGGMLCGKSYEDIRAVLRDKYGHEPIEGAEEFEEEEG